MEIEAVEKTSIRGPTMMPVHFWTIYTPYNFFLSIQTFNTKTHGGENKIKIFGQDSSQKFISWVTLFIFII